MTKTFLFYLKLITTVSVCFLATPWSVAAIKMPTIASSVIPNLISDNPSQRGTYNLFLDTLPKHKLIFMPPSRIEIEFDKSYIDCIFPASSQGIDDMSALIETAHISEIGAFVFSQQSQWKDKERPLIAIRHGFEYGNIRDKLVASYIELPSDLDGARMLENGRVDALIGYITDVSAAYKLINRAVPSYNEKNPIYVQRDAMICKDTAVNRDFVDHVNKSIELWLESR